MCKGHNLNDLKNISTIDKIFYLRVREKYEKEEIERVNAIWGGGN